MAEELKCEVTMHGGGAGFGHDDWECGQPARILVNGFPCCAHNFEEYEQEGLIETVSVPVTARAFRAESPELPKEPGT